MYEIHISNNFCFGPCWYRQHWSCHLVSEYFNLLIECAHVIEIYGHTGLSYMTGGNMDLNGHVKPTIAL